MDVQVETGFLGTLMSILLIVARWQMYKKMGFEGWESLIPLYRKYVLFKKLYGNGWKFLLMGIPFVHIFYVFKLNIDLAHGFNEPTIFGIGRVFLGDIFTYILAFSKNIVWGDGSTNYSSGDFFDKANDFVDDKLHGSSANKSTADKLKELKRLYDEGVLTSEEYERKRKELIDNL